MNALVNVNENEYMRFWCLCAIQEGLFRAVSFGMSAMSVVDHTQRIFFSLSIEDFEYLKTFLLHFFLHQIDNFNFKLNKSKIYRQLLISYQTAAQLSIR